MIVKIIPHIRTILFIELAVFILASLLFGLGWVILFSIITTIIGVKTLRFNPQAMLLIFPGLVTDILGLLSFLPRKSKPQTPQSQEEDVIEGEFWRESDK